MGIHEFYEDIDLDKVREFITDGKEEDLHLDFKRVNSPRMDRDDKKNFARALSGYSNSDGGIILWGVDARGNADGLNCACGEYPISSLQLFISKLNEFTGSHVNPTVDGVIHDPIDIDGDSGFAKTLIPASDSTPHMAKGGEDRYYKRSGDRFLKMEHYEIEDMFGRRPKPKLRLVYRIIEGGGRRGNILGFEIIIGVENYGKGLARAPYFSIKTNGPCSISRYGLDGNGTEGLARLIISRDSQWVRYGGMGDIVIHPGTELDILALRGKFDPDATGFTHQVIDYQIAAEGIKLINDTMRIDVNILIRDVRRAWK